MPLRASYIPHEGPSVIVPTFQTIEAGQVGTWLDKSQDIGRWIIARCLLPDVGAGVYIVEDPTILKTYDDGRILIAALDDDNFYESISSGFKFELDIVDYEDEAGRLILQHLSPAGTIQSYN